MRRMEVQSQPRQNSLSYSISKITRANWTGGVAQEVEHLLSQHEALSSNPSTDKQSKKNKVHTIFKDLMWERNELMLTLLLRRE
jgi:hypothetical protein